MKDTKNYNQEEFEVKRELVLSTLKEMATMSPGGGLYIKDIDCSGGIYSFNDICIDENGHVLVKASMWEKTELSEKTGYFRD